MAEELRKYKCDASSGTRPNTASALKSEILRSLKADISEMIKSKLKSALANDFSSLKNEIQALKTEIINNTAVIHSEIDQMKATIKEVDGGLSARSEEVTTLQSVVTDLKAEVTGLREKCEDMEGRMRRCNIR